MGWDRPGASPQPCAIRFFSCRGEPVLPRHCRHDPAVPALVQPAGAILQGLLGDLHTGDVAGRPGGGSAVFLPPQLLWGVWAAMGWPPTLCPSLSALLPSQFILFYIFLDLSGTTLHYGAYRFPRWGQALGICMGVLSCIQIPLWAGIALCKESGTLVAVSRGREPRGSWEGPLVGKTFRLSPAGLQVCPSCAAAEDPKGKPCCKIQSVGHRDQRFILPSFWDHAGAHHHCSFGLISLHPLQYRPTLQGC